MSKNLHVKSFSGYSQADRKVVSLSAKDSVQVVHNGEKSVKNISDFNTKIDLTSLYYDMTNEGYAVIFDNSELYNNCIPKVGMDVKELAECLKSRNFDVDICLKFHISEIFEKIHKIKEEKTNISCLLVIVMSVGKHWRQISAHDGFYSDDKLWHGFLGTMIGIPKIFLIQTVQDYKQIQPIGEDEADGFFDIFTSKHLKLKIPLAADILLVFSTSLDRRPMLNLDPLPRSSWYITYLCEALNEKNNDNMDLLQILTEIIGIIYDEVETDESQQIPQIESMLTKLVKFNRVIK